MLIIKPVKARECGLDESLSSLYTLSLPLSSFSMSSICLSFPPLLSSFASPRLTSFGFFLLVISLSLSRALLINQQCKDHPPNLALLFLHELRKQSEESTWPCGISNSESGSLSSALAQVGRPLIVWISFNAASLIKGAPACKGARSAGVIFFHMCSHA